MHESTPAMTCDELTKRYPDGTLALAGVSLEIAAGTSRALVRGNGAGKSTLLHLVLGLLHPTAGTVTVLGDREATRAHPRVDYLPSPLPALQAVAQLTLWPGAACCQAGAQGQLTAFQAAAMPFLLHEIAAVALIAGHRFGRRDVVLAA